jgi:L-aspartate oxidase
MDWQTDILVIGTGIAGCSAALAAARSGASVLLITGSDDLLDSNTSYAQGGIVTRGVNDSPGQLAEDILQAGAGLCYPAAVQFLAENGPAIVDRLLVKELGVEFSKGPDGIFDITEEAAHSMPRILHADDLTGRAIILRMLAAVRAESRITIKTGCLAVDLLNIPDHSANRLDIYRPPACVGAYVLETATGGHPHRTRRRRRSWPPAVWARSTSTRPTPPSHAATALPWPTASGRASSTSNTSSFTPPPCTTATPTATS